MFGSSLNQIGLGHFNFEVSSTIIESCSDNIVSHKKCWVSHSKFELIIHEDFPCFDHVSSSLGFGRISFTWVH